MHPYIYNLTLEKALRFFDNLTKEELKAEFPITKTYSSATDLEYQIMYYSQGK